MRSFATKQPSNQDFTHQKPVSATPRPIVRTSSTGLNGSAMLQRKPGCACGGGCPRCQEEALLQTKLNIGEPGDQYEQEADRVADQVMRMLEASLQRQAEPKEKEEKEAIQLKPLANQIMPLIQRQEKETEEEEGDLVQSKSSKGNADVDWGANKEIESDLHRSKRSGMALAEPIQAAMGKRFGADFSQVRIHTDSSAADLSQQLGAQAFTHGSDIFFNKGLYNPHTIAGKRLLAHELTHVIQQTGGRQSQGVAVSRLLRNFNSRLFIQRQPFPYQYPHQWAFNKWKKILKVSGRAKKVNYRILSGFWPIKSCTKGEKKILKRYIEAAITWINDVAPKIQAVSRGRASRRVNFIVRQALMQNFHTNTARDIRTLAQNFSTLQKLLNGKLNFECPSQYWCPPTSLAYVRGKPGSWILKKSDINICPYWFRCGNYHKRVSTIIHEVAHKLPATRDVQYEDQPGYATMPVALAMNNCSSYEVATRQIYNGGSLGPGLIIC